MKWVRKLGLARRLDLWWRSSTLTRRYLGVPPPIILIFGYVTEDRKIRNTCLFIFPRFRIWGVKTAFKVRGWKIIFVEKMDFLKIWWGSHISHSKTQNLFIDTIPLSLIVLEIFHKNDFSTLTLNAVFTPQICKRGKIKKHVFLIFRSSVTYPKIEMIGGGHLIYSPCKSRYRGGAGTSHWQGEFKELLLITTQFLCAAQIHHKWRN